MPSSGLLCQPCPRKEESHTVHVQAGAAHVSWSWSRMLTPRQQLACWIVSCHICSHLEAVGRKASACSPKPRLHASAPACHLSHRTAAAPRTAQLSSPKETVYTLAAINHSPRGPRGPLTLSATESSLRGLVIDKVRGHFSTLQTNPIEF